MKNIFKKISLLLVITSLIVPTTAVGALEESGPEVTPSVTPGVTPQVPEEKPEVTPSVTPQVPEEKPEAPSKNDDATLKSLKIKGIEFQKSFTPSNLEYKVVVKNEVNSVYIDATPNNPLSKLDSSSKIKQQALNVGENIFKIKVVAENGKSLTYSITVIRSTGDLKLTKLNIQGQRLNEMFDPNNFEYTADVTYNVRSIYIQTGKPVGTTVSVKGNSNLKVGKNVVVVTVKNASGETQDYKIVVTRSAEEKDDEKEEDDTTSEIITSTPTSDDSDSDDKNTANKVEKETDENNLRSVIIITSSVLLILIAGLGIYFYIRTGDSEQKKQKKIDKLKKKQAKIEEQLTGLMPVITEEQEQEYINKSEENTNTENLDETEELDDDTEEFELEFDKEDELETTIEIKKEDLETSEDNKKRRVDRNIFDEDLDDLFDDRDE